MEKHELILKMYQALIEAESVLKIQNDGNCLVSILEAIEEAQEYLKIPRSKFV